MGERIMLQFTIRFETENKDASKYILDSLKTGSVVNGIKVTAITDGDLFERFNATVEQLDIYMEHTTYDLDNEDQNEFDLLQDKIDNSWNREL
jgi:hypothetical protein